LNDLRDSFDPSQTFEGENNMILQQTSNILISKLGSPKKATPMKTFDFLYETPKVFNGFTEDVVHDVMDAYKWLVGYYLKQTAADYDIELAKNKGCVFSARNNVQVHRAQSLSIAYAELTIIDWSQQFISGVEQLPIRNIQYTPGGPSESLNMGLSMSPVADHARQLIVDVGAIFAYHRPHVDAHEQFFVRFHVSAAEVPLPPNGSVERMLNFLQFLLTLHQQSLITLSLSEFIVSVLPLVARPRRTQSFLVVILAITIFAPFYSAFSSEFAVSCECRHDFPLALSILHQHSDDVIVAGCAVCNPRHNGRVYDFHSLHPVSCFVMVSSDLIL
uniref:ACOX domain-containing protein n=1 Tax=Heligmosomoides polygyrus TaxID=6339 RepID=A0A183FMF7_HELPZ